MDIKNMYTVQEVLQNIVDNLNIVEDYDEPEYLTKDRSQGDRRKKDFSKAAKKDRIIHIKNVVTNSENVTKNGRPCLPSRTSARTNRNKAKQVYGTFHREGKNYPISQIRMIQSMESTL